MATVAICWSIARIAEPTAGALEATILKMKSFMARPSRTLLPCGIPKTGCAAIGGCVVALPPSCICHHLAPRSLPVWYEATPEEIMFRSLLECGAQPNGRDVNVGTAVLQLEKVLIANVDAEPTALVAQACA